MGEAIVLGLTLGLALAISVGPVIFTVIKQSLVNGKQGGFCFVAGVWLSDILLVIVSNAFSEVIKNLMVYKKSLGYIGSGFLVAMGIFYIFFKKIKLQANRDEPDARFRKRDMARIFSSGFFINTLNPSVFLFWLTPATSFSIKYSFQQRLIIFTVCLALNIAADIIKVLMAGKLRSRLTLHNLSVINKISGTLLIGFGIALFVGTILLTDQTIAV